MARYTKKDKDGRYYIESVNGKLESNIYGHTYGEAIDRFAELENADVAPKTEGEWIVTDADSGSFGEYAPFIEFKCPKCESAYGIESGQYGWEYGDAIPWIACPLCGAKMNLDKTENSD